MAIFTTRLPKEYMLVKKGKKLPNLEPMGQRMSGSDEFVEIDRHCMMHSSGWFGKCIPI